MNRLVVESVSYEYPKSSDGIHDVSLSASNGDFVGVIGRNGAGKSTLFNMLAGITMPQDGAITLDGERLTYHDIGFCPQTQSIDWYLNVKDNIMLGALLAGMPRREADESCARIMQMLELSAYSDRSSEDLSGGQQQRLQVARALVHNPSILILDEPTTGLDYSYSVRLFDYLRELTEAGAIIFLSSHDLDLVEDYCNKILFLNDGRAEYFGEKDDYLSQYHLTNVMEIVFSGQLSEDTQRYLEETGAEISSDTVVVHDTDPDVVGSTIVRMVGEVTISGMRNIRLGLKAAMIRDDVNGGRDER